MAYSLRYYKDLEQPNGQIVRLEIFEKDGTAPAVQIGRVVQSLSLDIQGGADAIDAPIVKTSLKMTFVDAADLHDGKCGDWQEFYTADATKWKVVLYAGPSRGSYTKIWGGFVTPDSYSEQLRYRGSVTIIARDNIGHMQDFPFDMDGNADKMITLRELVDAAWAKIESPMTLDWLHEEQEATYLRCNGIDAIDTYLNVSAFEGMNYYDAVEKALYAYGLVMRYNGRNIVSVMSLRDLPKQGKAQKPSTVAPTFIAGAEREFAPAVKRIEESVKYEFGEGVQAPLANGIEFTGVQNSCPFTSTNIFGESKVVNIPVHPIARTSGEGWSNIASSTLFFNPKRYTIRDAKLKEDVERMIFLAGNTGESRSVIYRKAMYCSPFRIEVGFGRVVTRVGNEVSYCYGFAQGTEDQGVGSIRVRELTCYIAAEQGSVTKYYDGANWSSDVCKIILEPSEGKVGVDVGFDGLTGNVTIAVVIESISIDSQRDYSNEGGMYVPIQSLEFVAADALSLCETNNVNTNYDADNNVILSHNPEIAPALNEVPFPNVIKNGIYVKSGSAYLPAKEWAWSGGTAQQMAVYNHLQLLCYHAKPNNVISGDIVNVDFLNMERIYSWGGAEHILVSGSYDFISGRIAGAVLREFAWYDSMWGNVSGTPQGAEQSSRTVAEGSGRASNTSTYNNETTVNIGETSGGGGGGGVTTLAALNDVNLVNLADGQSLVYDLAQGRWVNQKISVDYTLPLASASARGGIKVGFSAKYQNGNYYSIPVELDSEKAFVKLTKTMVATALGFTPVSSADIEVTKAKVINALGYTPMNPADFTGDSIVAKLGYTPFDADDFTKNNIKSKLGIQNWALGLLPPVYSKSDVGLGNVDNLAASAYLTALSSSTTNAVSITVGGVTKNITVATLKSSLGLQSFAYRSSLGFSELTGIPTTLAGYGIKKNDIITTIGISSWALAVSKPSYTKSEVGLGNVDNLAASAYLTALGSNSTNAVSITVGGTTKNITVATLKSSLGLQSFAYRSSLAFSELTSKPTTLTGYGIAKADLINTIGIEDWALESSKPRYEWSEIGSRPTKLSDFTNDLGLGNLAYKNSLAASDIPSLDWSKITSGKPTTLAGYGITDGVIYQQRIDATSAYRHIGYGYAAEGWPGSGPAMSFGTALYNLRLQLAISSSNYPKIKVSQVYNGTAYGWAELMTYESVATGDLDVGRYLCGGTYMIHQSGDDRFLNYGNRVAGDLFVFGKNIRFSPDGGASFPLRVLNNGFVQIHGVNLSAGTSNALKSGAYEADVYYSDSKMILHRNAGYSGTYLNYGGRAETLFLYGSVFSFQSGDSPKTVFSINNGYAEFFKSLTVDGTLTANEGATIPSGKSLKIGDAVISWDATNERLVISKGLYSSGAITAGAKS